MKKQMRLDKINLRIELLKARGEVMNYRLIKKLERERRNLLKEGK